MHKTWSCMVVVLAITLMGCDLLNRDFSRPEDETGTLVLLFDGSAIPTRTIAPPNMTAAQYDIELTHATAPTITELDWSSTAYTKGGLAQGVWTIKVTAEDSGGNDIGAILGSVSGTDTVTIVIGDTATKTVQIIPLSGTGGLSLNLSWPEGSLSSPVTVASWLVPETATLPYTSYSISFTVDQGNRTASYTVPASPGITAGYYTLVLQLTGDGSSQPDWGWAESVRIVNGATTSGTLSLESGAGGLELTISTDLENPIVINWSSPSTPPSSITQGGDVEITASPAQAAADGYAFYYQWYLDGAPLAGETSAALEYGPTYGDAALAVGEYTMCVVVTEKIESPLAVRTISSNGFSFTVTP